MKRSLAKRLFYDVLWVVTRMLAVVLFSIRVENRGYVPAAGGALVLSNHQSNFDPVLVGLACDRRLNFLARQTLFEINGLRQLITALDAIPIDREGTGLAGLKETLRRLKRGELVLIFPEGTRTRDGAVAPLKPGFLRLARRGGVPLVPLAIEGAYAAWPRGQRLPGRAKMRVVFGPPLTPGEIDGLDDAQLVAEIEGRIRACHARACTI